MPEQHTAYSWVPVDLDAVSDRLSGYGDGPEEDGETLRFAEPGSEAVFAADQVTVDSYSATGWSRGPLAEVIERFYPHSHGQTVTAPVYDRFAGTDGVWNGDIEQFYAGLRADGCRTTDDFRGHDVYAVDADSLLVRHMPDQARVYIDTGHEQTARDAAVLAWTAEQYPRTVPGGLVGGLLDQVNAATARLQGYGSVDERARERAENSELPTSLDLLDEDEQWAGMLAELERAAGERR